MKTLLINPHSPMGAAILDGRKTQIRRRNDPGVRDGDRMMLAQNLIGAPEHLPDPVALEVLRVSVEPLQSITPDECRKEGCPPGVADPVRWFVDYWTATYGAGSWERNDPVWVVEFKISEAP